MDMIFLTFFFILSNLPHLLFFTFRVFRVFRGPKIYGTHHKINQSGDSR